MQALQIIPRTATLRGCAETGLPAPKKLPTRALEGALQNIKLDIPAGAWPAGLGVGRH
jgi:hypothetical protein